MSILFKAGDRIHFHLDGGVMSGEVIEVKPLTTSNDIMSGNIPVRMPPTTEIFYYIIGDDGAEYEVSQDICYAPGVMA